MVDKTPSTGPTSTGAPVERWASKTRASRACASSLWQKDEAGRWHDPCPDAEKSASGGIPQLPGGRRGCTVQGDTASVRRRICHIPYGTHVQRTNRDTSRKRVDLPPSDGLGSTYRFRWCDGQPDPERGWGTLAVYGEEDVIRSYGSVRLVVEAISTALAVPSRSRQQETHPSGENSLQARSWGHWSTPRRSGRQSSTSVAESTSNLRTSGSPASRSGSRAANS